MRIFTRLTRHIDIRLGFNFGRVRPSPPRRHAHHVWSIILPFFFVSRPRPEYWAGVVVVSQNEKKEERFSLSLLPILGFFRPLCVHRMGRRQWITYHLEGCRPQRRPSPRTLNLARLCFRSRPFPSDLSRDGKVCDEAYEMRQVLFLPFFLSFLLALVNEAF